MDLIKGGKVNGDPVMASLEKAFKEIAVVTAIRNGLDVWPPKKKRKRSPPIEEPETICQVIEEGKVQPAVIARWSRGYTRRSLAAESGVSVTQIKAAENDPTSSASAWIARFLDYPISFFQQPPMELKGFMCATI